MNQNWDNHYFDRLLADRNYIAAYQYIKTHSPPEPEYSEYSGRLAGAVIDELSRVNKREEQDRVAYLRSILAWIFRDIPGLSGLYREQLRGTSGADTVSEMYRGIRNFNDVASGRKSVGEGIEDAFQQMRDQVEKVAEQFRDRLGRNRSRGGKPEDGGPASNEAVNEFLRGAEHTITEGLRQVGMFFENARREAEANKKDDSSVDETKTTGSVQAEDESGATIHVDIVDDEKGSSPKEKSKKR